MNAIGDQELAAYVLGDAPEELRARVEAAAAADEGFAAELEALAALGLPAEVGPGIAPAPQQSRRARRPLAGWRRVVLAVGILLVVAGVAWGGYELLRTPPLLDDNFSSRTISHTRWDPHLGRKGISAQEGYLQLLNRGSVVTRREFAEPIEITFDWRWVDLGHWPLYAEVFCVGLRTHGQHKAEHDYRIGDGLLIALDTVENCVKAGRGDALAFLPLLGRSPPDSAPMPAGAWHRVRIVDDGETVTVFLEGPSIDPKYKKEPILTVAVPEGLTGRRIALFNREYVAGTNHESHVDNVKIWAVKR